MFYRFAIKASVAGGFTYYTVQEGLWSDSKDSIKLYCKVYNKVAPYVKENIPKELATEVYTLIYMLWYIFPFNLWYQETMFANFCFKIPDLPSVTDVSRIVKSSWNKGVIATFQFLSNLPEHTSNAIEASGIKSAILGAIDSVNAPIEKPNES